MRRGGGVVALLLLLAAVVVVLCPSWACGSQDVDESDVVVLTAHNFDALTSQGAWMVEFFAPWCGHCRSLKPTWAQFATKSKGTINVGKVDCTNERDLAARFGIRSLPTIKLIRDGKLYDFNMRRTVEDFVTFAETGYAAVEAKEIPAAPGGSTTETAAPAAAPAEDAKAPASEKKQVAVLTSNNFDQSTESGDWFVEFYAPWCGHCKRLAPIWDQLAAEADDSLRVAKVDCTAYNGLCARFGVRGYPTIKLFQDGEPKDYSGGRTVEAFLSFYRKAKEESASTDKKDEL